MFGRSALMLLSIVVAGCRDSAIEHDTTVQDSQSDRDAVSEQDAPPGPRISVDHNEIDLGPLGLFPNEHKTTFQLSNVGSEPLEIDQIEVSCGCLNALPAARVIQPGETIPLDVTVSVDGAGEKTTQVVLHINDPVHPSILLLVRWTGVAAAEAIPSRIDFGQIRPGESVTRHIDVRLHNETLDWPRHEMSVSDAVAAVATQPAEEMIAGYDVSVTAQREEGRGRGHLSFSTEGAEPSLLVLLEWEVVDVVSVTPESLFLGSGTAGTELKRHVVIRSNVEEPVEIVTATISGTLSGIDIAFPSEPSNVMMVEIKGMLPATPGPLAGDLQVVLSKPEPRTLTIPISGIVTVANTIVIEDAHHAHAQ